MKILGIDPGTEFSAWLCYDAALKKPIAFEKVANNELLNTIKNSDADKLAIEMVACYGMPVGASTFQTAVWIGRFLQHWLDSGRALETTRLVFRKRDICPYFCGTARAKDSNIRQALMDRYGSSRRQAIGTRKQPGPLYGISADIWSALAIAIYTAETQETCAKCEQLPI